MPKTTTNSGVSIPSSLLTDLDWLKAKIESRINEAQSQKVFIVDQNQLKTPTISEGRDNYSRLILSLHLQESERLLLLLGIVPALYPALLNDRLIDPDNPHQVLFPEFGGYVDKVYHKFTPTLATALYLIAGADMKAYISTQFQLLEVENSKLISQHIVLFQDDVSQHRYFDGLNLSVRVSEEYIKHLLLDVPAYPDHGKEFPARLISTAQEWEELILPEYISRQLNTIENWVKHKEGLIAVSNHKISTNFMVLFHGAPGTGKTFCAKLLGKRLGLPVFRIDLSMLVSKYIGETEKNLRLLFERAKGMNWILFFDEADAVFSKRTDVKDSKDKYANQTVSYLLEQLEEYEGVVILSSNLKENIDRALQRRFHLSIGFPLPGPTELKQLWYSLLPKHFKYAEDVDLSKYNRASLSGANIARIIKSICIQLFSSNENIIKQHVLDAAVRTELAIHNRTL